MTPIVLLILVGMWTAVLLPPYLRDRNDTRAAGPQSPVGNRLSSLSKSFGNRERSGYLPVSSHSLGAAQQPGSPLPAGARHPLTRRGAPVAVPDPPQQSTAFSILGPTGRLEDDPQYLLAPDEDLGDEAPVATARAIPPAVLAARAARKRRREVLYTLLAASGLSLLMAIGLGGPVIALHLLIDLMLITYVALLVRRQKARAEREIKVAFLPHGGEGISPSELLAQGGGFRPGKVELATVDLETSAFRVVRPPLRKHA